MAERWTDKEIAALPIPAAGAKIVYDGALPGFGVRTTASGARSFIFNYRHQGRERRLTIGSFPSWRGAAARKRAEDIRRQIDRGEDPLAERDEARAGRTVAELWAAFDRDHLPSRRASTAAEYRRQAKTYIIPKLGSLRVAAVRRENIAALHRDIARTHPYLANRVLALLSVMFSLAIEREMCEANPCARIPKAPEERREAFLTPAEIGRLAEALRAHPEKISAAAIRLLMLTGSRKSEVLAAKWSEFDLTSAVWTKPSSNTKQKRSHRVPLAAAAVAVLVEMQAEGERLRRDGILTPYVFPSIKRPADALTEVRRTWAAACKTAGLRGIRLHDLRHSFASALVSGGVGLPAIGAMLGHSQPRTTARYAHLYDATLREAAERIGGMVTPLRAAADTATRQPAGEAAPLSGGKMR
jgi:integrase